MNDGLWLLNWEKCLYPEGYQCDIAQYRLLKECSESKCITKWNEWRERNPNTEIWLQGANLSQWDLQDADFSNANCERAHFWKAHCERALFQDANCAGASFQQAYCEKAEFNLAHCEKTRFWKADCNNACFCNAYCDQADFTLTHCQKAEFDFADCGNSVFASANCEGANFSNASCEGALFVYANCEGAIFDRANLNNACFSNVIVSSRSSFLECKMNRNTLLTNSSLSSIMTESGTRALLERNLRQAEWEKWYVDHPIQKWPVRFFWLISDYGYSTGNVILCFFATWVIFSLIYSINPELLVKTTVLGQLESMQRIWCNGVDWLQLPLFALATMVTLGFGNINAASTTAMLVVCLNLMAGYFLLAVLITRLGVLFQTMGPGHIVPKERSRKPQLPQTDTPED